MRRHERLLAWKACHTLSVAVYRATRSWPVDERFGLTGQIRRAATSAVLNLVEGVARRGPAEFARFLRIACGSLAEVEYLLDLATEVGACQPETKAELGELVARAGRLTWSLCRRMETAARRP